MAKTKAAEGKVVGVAGRKAHHTIESLEVSEGFLKGAKFEFVDGLNCIIGGRGTGKTTVLEFVRHALEMAPDEKASPARARFFRAQIQANLCTGQVKLGVRTKHGVGYVAARPFNDSTHIFNEQKERTAISFDRDLIFKADVYSQNEIEEMATSPALQLALLDNFVEEDVRRINAEILKLGRDLDLNASALTQLDHKIRDLRESASEMAIMEEKLKALQQTSGPDAEVVNQAHAHKALREKERKTVDDLRGDLRKLHSETKGLFSTWVRRLESRIDSDLNTGPNRDVFRALSGQIDTLTALLERGVATIGEQVESTGTVVTDQAKELADAQFRQDAEYRELMAKTQEETGRAVERTRTQERYAEASSAKKELDIKQQERKEREQERHEATARLSLLRDERFALRKKIAETLTEQLNPTIRVSISHATNRDTYRAQLTDALKGQSMKHNLVADRIVESLTPEELARLVQKGDAYRLTERSGVDEERSQKTVNALRDMDLLYRLETIELEDQPKIELLDGNTYKDAGGLSTGQRCTTILPILLLESEKPLLIDQPEDNLDNAFIYGTIVKNLQGTKGKRQLIFVTHNPNIPVLGDADRVFVLTSDGKQGKLARVGTVDELKEDIELLLEGGSEAFLLRKKRYGH